VSSGGPAFVSRDGRTTYVAATVKSRGDEAGVVDAVLKRFDGRPGVTVGGGLVANKQLGDQISADLGRAEMLAFPVLILLSLLFFRGGRAALIPLLVGVVTILGAFLAMRLLASVATLSIFAINLIIGLGLGLAIDYSLFLLVRYREELERRGAGLAAVRATVASAGRTVLFSALTVAAALASLLVFPLNFLQSMGAGGALVALIAAAAALVIAPALFALWGSKLRSRPRASDAGAQNRWTRIAYAVMRRPGAVAVVTAAAMVALALPALRAQWAPVDNTSIPTQLSSRTVADALTGDFPAQASTPVTVAVAAGSGQGDEVRRYAAGLRSIPGVRSVQAPRRLDGETWQVGVDVAGDPQGAVTRGAVRRIRDTAAPFRVLVGGDAAEFIDRQAAIGSRLPVAVALLGLLTFAVLWLMTGSVVLPLKSLVMNALTVGASLGVLTLVFQDGRLEGLLGYTSNGGVESTDYLITAALVFALSTDYGVFLLARIKEARDAGLSDRDAVATGLGRTGGVVSAAAILLAVAIGAFMTSSVIFIKQIGVGTAVGVLVDAFVVRALLVPSLMALLGRWNWWSPGPLRRLWERVGIREERGSRPGGAAVVQAE
jgi:uncharacterized membrane protein YdfJ with MMPL/SSD domain